MSALFRRDSAIERRRRQIDRELASVDDNIKLLARAVRKSGRALSPPAPAVRQAEASPSRPAEQTAGADVERLPSVPAQGRAAPGVQRSETETERVVVQISRNIQDAHFHDYLASSIKSLTPLRQERRIQRNRAIVMAVVVLVILYIVLSSLLN